MPTATARLSSTTGDGGDLGEPVVERDDPLPVGVLGAAGARVAGGDRGLQRVRAERRRRSRTRAPAPRARGRSSIQSQRERSCSSSRIGSPVGPDPRARTRDACSSISATRPCTSGSSGSSAGEDAAEPQRLLEQLRPHPVVAGGGGVALVEDQVDHLEHRARAARAARRARAPRTARAPRSACAWRARSAARRSPPGTRYARAISCVVSPPSSRSVSATRASVESTGWQAVKISRSRSSSNGSSTSRGEVGRSASPRARARARAPRSCARAPRRAAGGRSRGACAVAMSQAPGLSGTP